MAAAAPAPGAEAGLPPQPLPGEGLPGTEVPPAAPVAESMGGSHPKARLIKAIHTAKKHGAKLDTKLDFGHKEMTLHDCMKDCGMSPQDFGYEEAEENGTMQMLKDIAGFWNHEAKNFTIGGTRAKTKIVKGFKNGEFSNATDEDLHKVLALIDKMDPSGDSNHVDDTHHQEPEVSDMERKVHHLGAMEQHPSMYESEELTAMLRIAGLRK